MPRLPNVLIANNPEALQQKVNMDRSATVEAEFGEQVVKGTLKTLVHHGPRAGNPAPCLESNRFLDMQVIGVSHVDLDTIGGIMAITNQKPDDPESKKFWEAAAFVDVNGPHKIRELDPDSNIHDKLCAYWAFSQAQENRVFPPRDGSVADITDQVKAHVEAVHKIAANDPELIQKGQEWFESQQNLNAKSYVEHSDYVIFRESDQFANHLYETPDGDLCKAVVGFNPEKGRATLSLADPIEGVSCREIMQEVFGPGAGGRDNIAGSPYDMEATREQVVAVFELAHNKIEAQIGPDVCPSW